MAETTHTDRLKDESAQSIFAMAHAVIDALEARRYTKGEVYVKDRLDTLPVLEVKSVSLPANSKDDPNFKKFGAVSILVDLAINQQLQSHTDGGVTISGGKAHFWKEEIDPKYLDFERARETVEVARALLQRSKAPPKALVPNQRTGAYWIGPFDNVIADAADAVLEQVREFHQAPRTMIREVPTDKGTYYECDRKPMLEIARKEGLQQIDFGGLG